MPQKVFATRSGKANFTCPECGKVKQMDVSRFRNVDKEIKLKCTCICTHTFSVILERRKYIRKAVNLDGSCHHDNEWYPVKVIDISRLGLKIKIEAGLNVSPGEKLVIDFVLDDADGSRVSKEVIIRTVPKTALGVEFLSQDHYDKLGTYLLFHFS